MMMLLPLAGAALLVAALALPAYAHPFTLETVPSGNGPEGTTQVIVFYSEEIDVDFSSLSVFDSHGNQIDLKDLKYYRDEKALSVSTPPLEPGVYTVSSKVLSKVDGHLVPDAFVFGIGGAVIPEDIDSHKELIFYPEAAARFPGLAGQTIILGAAISMLFVWGMRPSGLDAKLRDSIRKRFLSITGAGILLTAASCALIMAVQTWRLETGIIEVLGTDFGTSWLARAGITGALAALWLVARRGAAIQYAILGASLALIATTTMMGHGMASGQPAAAALDYAHNLVAAAWIGGVIFFGFVLLPSLGQNERSVLAAIPRFSILAILCIGAILVTGPILLWMLEDNLQSVTESAYGKIIMAKIGLAAAMAGVGAYHQVLQGRAATRNEKIAKKLERALKAESMLGIVLLGLVALLVNGTLPAGEIMQDADATYGMRSLEFGNMASFDVDIYPLLPGPNSITVSVHDIEPETVTVKISNPEKNISPIHISTTKNGDTFTADATFGFYGTWVIEIEASGGFGSDGITITRLIKPGLDDLEFQITEYAVDGRPLFPVFDGTHIWVSDTSRPVLWRVSADGTISEVRHAGKASQAATVDRHNKIWFADAPNIGYLDIATNNSETIRLPQNLYGGSDPAPVAILADGDRIWIAVINKNAILGLDQATGEFETIMIDGLPFALLAQEALWFGDTANNKIGKVVDGQAGYMDFEVMGPEAMMATPDSIWITEHAGAGLVRFDPALEISERIPVSKKDSLPFGMAQDGYGNIWFAQHQIDYLGVYDPHHKTLRDVPIPTESSFVQFLASDADGRIWFAEQNGGKIGVLSMVELPPESLHRSRGGSAGAILYAEAASPLMAAGLFAVALFFVKAVRDKRRFDEMAYGS